MPRQNLETIAKAVIKKYQQRDKKQRPKMKVSGSGVKQLQRIIKQK